MIDKKLNGIENVMPLKDIINEFFSRESTSLQLLDLWRLYFLAIGNPEVDSYEANERSDMAYAFEQIFLLIARLHRHRQ